MESKTLNLLKHILFLSFSGLMFIFSFVVYIQSRFVESSNWERSDGSQIYQTEISFNMDAVIGIVVFAALIVYGVYALLQDRKGKDSTFVGLSTGAVVSAIVSIYYLQVFFKALVKASVKNEAFAYMTYQGYLFLGLGVLVFFAYSLVKVIVYLKENK